MPRPGYLWLKEQVSERQATRWYNGLVDAVYSLDTLPLRCPLAAESEELGIALRQLLYGKRSATYRILFALVREGDEEVVRVYRIWHGARDRIQTQDIEDVP
jgi:plasmid stabilization system protein ParE